MKDEGKAHLNLAYDVDYTTQDESKSPRQNDVGKEDHNPEIPFMLSENRDYRTR